MPDPAARPLRAALDALESREVPTATPWLVEPFQHGPAAGLPAGWAAAGPAGAAKFHVDPAAAGLGGGGRLESAGSSAPARAWVSAPFGADVEASAAVYLGSAAPARLFVRGQNLNTAAPSYYAVEVGRGGALKLVEVSRGVETVHGTVRAPDALADKWVTVTVNADGDKLRVSLYRGDTSQYLTGDAKWTRQPTAALEVTDTTTRGGGQVGFSRAAGAGEVAVDSLRVGPAEDGAPRPIVEERFGRGVHPGAPPGWVQWAAGPAAASTTADETLNLSTASNTPARAYLSRSLPADVQVSASVFVDSAAPAGVFARGANVSTATPTYYALEVSRGLEAKLVKVVRGVRTDLGAVRSKEWVAGVWVQTSLVLNGDQLRAQVYRSDTGQYLKEDGTWGLSPTWAMTRRDAAVRANGIAGLSRGAGPAGKLTFDNVIITTSPDRYSKPGAIPTGADKPTVMPNPGEDLPGPTPTPVPPTAPPPAAGANPALPPVKRHYSHVRLADLAYYGTPMGPTEKELLRNSVDLVIPNLTYLDAIDAANPTTPQFVYTNVSNVYLGLLTDWNDYADRNRVDREGAFYHVRSAQKFAGMSASAVPVNRFWSVRAGSDAAGWDDRTRDSRNTGNALTFAPRSESVALGYLEKFRELNLDVTRAAGAGWHGELEYVSAVDGQGRPTRWSKLPTLADSSNGFKRDGRVTFDPPRDWQAARVGDSARLFYVRVRTTGSGAAPVATATAADYTAGNTIPAFDSHADRDGDGYLSDAEYAVRRTGHDARFEYQSRLTYPNYGPMRFATNVSDPTFRAWAADYHARFLAATPKADGFFVDNSIGRLAADPDTIKEDLAGYSADYGSLLGAVNKKLSASGKWLIANTAGGNSSAEPIIRNGVSYLEEYALRPLSANHVQFEDLMATLAYRRQISGRRAYEILDSLPTQNIDANDPRMQLSTLAMYYAVADADLSFLMVNGGNEPASGWDRHFFGAIEADVGKPRAAAHVFATGQDPANRNLAYKVYAREYTHALVLYKPVSYTRGQTGGVGGNTATTHHLDGTYRPVRADGTLGAPTRTVTLRNGEGAVLVRA